MDKVMDIVQTVLSRARPAARDGHEAVALAVHSVCVARGLHPVRGEAAEGDSTDSALSALPSDGWSGEDGDVIELRYTREGKPGVVLKLLKMGPVLLVHGVAGDPEVATEVETLELAVADYVNADAPLDDGNRAFTLGISKLVSSTETYLTKLGVAPPGATGAAAAAGSAPARSAPARQGDHRRADPRHDPLRADPLRADPLRVGPIHGGPGYGGGRPWNPAGDIGRGDLDPFGRGGGMLLDPRGMGAPYGGMPPLGRGQLPGARFDPVFPGGPMGPRPPGGGGFPQGPDPNHMPMPPDNDDLDMFG
eukprot:m.461419 g.461419  ORF g.461419 m.461419 type:complete len:307 (+) comp22302_c0_seq1:226-1146(+)